MKKEPKSIVLSEDQINKICTALALEGRAMIKDIGILKMKSKIEPFGKKRVNILSFKTADYLKMWVRGLDKFR